MAPARDVTLQLARSSDTAAVAQVLSAAADRLTIQYGTGHWSRHTTDRGVRWLMRQGRVYVVKDQRRVIATLTMTPRKPWAIDTAHFAPVTKSVYVLSMAVLPDCQGAGIGRACVEQAVVLCRQWPADSLRLDAYDAPAGAGPFYRKCDFREIGRVTYRTVPLIYFERLV
jgi:GNAT superfamily N-acetyltransferase